MIYLDNNATTRPVEAVVLAVAGALREVWANPSSVHRLGQAARARVELARRQVAELVGARPRELVFTGSGTEAIDLALRGSLGALGPGAALVTSRIEHAAVRELAEELEKSGRRVVWLEVGGDGVISAQAVEAGLRSAGGGGAVVSVQWANNETGAVQPVREIARACAAAGAVFHCDATQWVGKGVTVLDDVPGVAGEALGAALVTFSAHKFHGPKGVGVLWARRGVKLRPTLVGTQELGRRGGTENVAGIIGAGVAAGEARAWLADPARAEAVGVLRDRFESLVLAGVRSAGGGGAVVNGPGSRGRLWNTTNIGFPRLEAEGLLLYLSERGVCASAGAACSSGSLDPSPVLLAMGVPAEVAHGSLRFSLSRETTADEVEEAARVVVEAVGVLSKSMPG